MKPLHICVVAVATFTTPLHAQQGNPGQHFIENWDLDGNGAVTVAEAQERRGDVFASFDADEDGYMTAEEYVLFDEARANDMEANAGGHGHGKMMRAADGMRLQVNDADGDGRVSQAEFVNAAESWVADMDRDGDGVVTTGDFGGRN